MCETTFKNVKVREDKVFLNLVFCTKHPLFKQLHLTVGYLSSKAKNLNGLVA